MADGIVGISGPLGQDIRQCKNCGKSFPAPSKRGRHQIFCSKTCLATHQYERYRDEGRYKVERQCVQCGKQWMASPISNRRPGSGLCQYCATQKAAKVKSEVYSIRRRFRPSTFRLKKKAKARAAARRAERAARPPKKKAQIFLECAVCKTPLVGRFPGTQYCSKECSMRAASMRKHGKKYVGTIRTCVVCGVQWSALYGAGRMVTCSDTCREQSIREAEAASKARARVKRKNSERHMAFSVDPRGWYVRASAVFRRDKWRCKACGCETPRELRGTHQDNAPELDHIVAVSKGGQHTMENLQCLCRLCNQLKGALDMGEFMRLWLKAAA